MKCPHCQNPKSRVVETRALSNTIWRRRQCTACDHVFFSQESRAERMPTGLHDMSKEFHELQPVVFRPAPVKLPADPFGRVRTGES